MKKIVITAVLTSVLMGCAPTPPKSVTNSCVMLDDKSSWYKSLKKVRKEYGTPIHVLLAMMRQESSFKHNAKTPRKYILGFIPWGRQSTAYGYAQVKDMTWDWYQQRTGRKSADRDDFYDAVRFMGWYSTVSQRTLGISKWDAYNQYLAYHEGHGGWKRKSFNKKPWLLKVARKVEGYAQTYAVQLKGCEDDLDSGWWPF
ncbi:transglycosylase SLT domain-containing protein [Temperatibacter marinus]|uniref:Transglycosylase SLT domain-containing protein n=1 Tax=Temperatibacter marinus TaxID=1456591 RepID=A0AA52H8I2_9PROT|nr:transglycosylase SLT domain-containing protein [Temperatibacter marinus]WND01477.1 transglycosylase SLT domain-containing protein [Temperatibacter marinus]